MVGLIIALLVLLVAGYAASLIYHWGKIQFALITLERLLAAYGEGKVSEVQLKVLMNELTDPHNLHAVRGVSEWLDEQKNV